MFSKRQTCHYERREVILFFIVTSILFLSLTHQTQAQSWNELFPSPDFTYGLPTTRLGHTAVYDTTNNRMILFGGFDNSGDYLNDVWVLRNANGRGEHPLGCNFLQHLI